MERAHIIILPELPNSKTLAGTLFCDIMFTVSSALLAAGSAKL